MAETIEATAPPLYAPLPQSSAPRVKMEKPVLTTEQKAAEIGKKYITPMGLTDFRRYKLAGEILFTTGFHYIAFIFLLLIGVLLLDSMFAEKQGTAVEGAKFSLDLGKIDYWKYTQFLLLGVLYSVSAIAFNVNNLAIALCGPKV